MHSITSGGGSSSGGITVIQLDLAQFSIVSDFVLPKLLKKNWNWF